MFWNKLKVLFLGQISYKGNIMGKNENHTSQIHQYDTTYEGYEKNEDWYETYII